MKKEEAIKAVVDLANAEVGYHEKASNAQLDDPTANSGGANWTKYARDLDSLPNFYNGQKNGYAWCDIFVDWCFVHIFGEELGRKMLYQPEKSAGAGCLYSAGYTSRTTLFTAPIRESVTRFSFRTAPGSIRIPGSLSKSMATP